MEFFPFRVVRFCGRFPRGANSFLLEKTAFQEVPKGSKFFSLSVVRFSVGYQGVGLWGVGGGGRWWTNSSLLE